MKEPKAYHFIGLGGIGMSALARILIQKGIQVKGSDAVSTPLLEQLQKEGAIVQIGHSGEGLSKETVVVFSSGIKPDNVEMIRARELGLSILHRSELLDLLASSKRGLLVTGTHGKTTTTALLASVLMEANWDPSFVIGGILQSCQTNGRAGSGVYFVAEADESDGSFLKTSPFGAIVTNLENDHLDYWGTEKKLDEAFGKFFKMAQNLEHLFWCGDDPRLQALNPPGISYGFSLGSELLISQLRQKKMGVSFDLSFKGVKYPEIELSLLGRHNALNGAAVFGLGLSLHVPEIAIRRAFQNFSGTRRRLESKGGSFGLNLYDDYGHHPTEISATLLALREAIGHRRLVAFFQPHRYTRVRDLLDPFSHCFGCADAVILTDIYGAGEAPIPGITTAALYTKMQEVLGAKVSYIPKSELVKEAARLLKPLDVAITLGAGDITHVGAPLLQQFDALQKGLR